MVKFQVTKKEMPMVHKCALRAVAMALEAGIKYPLQDAMMDLEAVHSNDIKLDFEKLSKADDANFGHDVFGIRRFINRENGMLTGCFVPRCAKPKKS